MAEDIVAGNDLIIHLRDVLLDLLEHPYPTVPSPSVQKKRASTALIVRVQPNYSHWPAEFEDLLATSKDDRSSRERIEAFFEQEWVRHGDPELLFIKRASRHGDKWSSHVAFPGGRRDPEDEDDLATAVRETMEEVGIDLKKSDVIATGNLPQRLVTRTWGGSKTQPYDSPGHPTFTLPSTEYAKDGNSLLMLCPYIFLITSPSPPALRLQPTEVASTHWVSLRALLAPAQRTFEYQDMVWRSEIKQSSLAMTLSRLALGQLEFAAVRLIPSASVYCSSIPGFIPAPPTKTHSLFSTLQGLVKRQGPTSPPDKPLQLWGLTLGMTADFLDLLPPSNAMKMWTYPTLTRWDIRLVLWLFSYRFRKRKCKQLDDGHYKEPYRTEGPEGIASRGLMTLEAPMVSSGSVTPATGGKGQIIIRSEPEGALQQMVVSKEASDEQPIPESGMAGLGVGRYAGRIKQDQRGSRADAVGFMLDGYYPIIKRAIAATLLTRTIVFLFAVRLLWRNYRSRR